MGAYIDITGQVFEQWTVLYKSDSVDRRAMWRCKCECGTIRDVVGKTLRNGTSKSCGCLKSEVTTQRSTKHGYANEGKITKVYYVWSAMVQRCVNPKSTKYMDYGGRGIKVCERWLDFENFISDMGDRPSVDHTLERINNDGHYEVSNCKWATRTEQLRNRRLSNKNISGVSGVCWDKRQNKWVARITVNYIS